MGGNDDDIQYYESIPLNGNGDFRSEECTLILQESDIVITNPPFSLAIDFINYLIDNKKKFLILCNINAIKQKNVFPHFINNLFWLGYDRSMNYHFKVPNTYTLFDEKFTDAMNDGCHYGKVSGIAWFTNLAVDIISTINLTSKYYGNEDNYPKYDNYDIINVDKSKDIPCDYYDIMGVPITFLLKWNPQQFDLLGTERWCKDNCVKALYRGKKATCDEDKAIILNGKELYTRLFIRRKEKPK